MTATTTLTVGIVLFDDVEVLDFAGPFEVFAVAGNVTEGGFHGRHRRGAGGCEASRLSRAMG